MERTLYIQYYFDGKKLHDNINDRDDRGVMCLKTFQNFDVGRGYNL